MGKDKLRPVLSPAQSLLHALINTIQRSLTSSTYLYETDRLLDTLKEHLEWYEKALYRFQVAGRHRVHTVLSKSVAKEFLNQKNRLVENIKGLCEGTTDAIPFPLAAYLNLEFSDLCKKHGVPPAPATPADVDDIEPGETEETQGGVALCPFRQFNYTYEDIGSGFAESFGKLDADIIKHVHVLQAPWDKLRPPQVSFSSFVMIAFQYAMGDNVFYQPFLFHELGHHLFEQVREGGYGRELSEALSERLKDPEVLRSTALNAKANKTVEEALKDPAKLERLVKAISQLERFKAPLHRWAEELFSDAFAVALAGPQYALAFRDITGPLRRGTRFGPYHPADALRQHLQWHTLHSIGWIADEQVPADDDTKQGRFESLAGSVFHRIRPTRDIAAAEWNFGEPTGEKKNLVLEQIAFLLRDEIPHIAELALDCVEDAGGRCSEFRVLGPHVKEMLENAIVPSTIVLDHKLDGADGAKIETLIGKEGTRKAWVYRPRPCTVMNVARLIYETGCEELLRKWPSKEGKEKEAVFRVHSRLSDWTQKAIADWLLSQQRGKTQ